MFCFYSKVAKRGEVLKVKVLGTVALIDEGKYFNTLLVSNKNNLISKNYFNN